MQISIKKSVFDNLPLEIIEDDFELCNDKFINDLIIDIKPTEERDVYERYSIQYEDNSNDKYITLLTNGFDDNKLIEILRYIQQYEPSFNWIESE